MRFWPDSGAIRSKSHKDHEGSASLVHKYSQQIKWQSAMWWLRYLPVNVFLELWENSLSLFLLFQASNMQICPLKLWALLQIAEPLDLKKWSVIISSSYCLKFHSVVSILTDLRFRLAAGELAGLSWPYLSGIQSNHLIPRLIFWRFHTVWISLTGGYY